MKSLFKSLFSLAGLAMCLPLSAQTMTEWDDVSVSSINRVPAHDLSIPFTSEADAQTLDLSRSPYFLSLNGTWKFNWAPEPSKAVSGFEADDFNAASWDDITVPLPWQVYAYQNNKAWDKPLYVNTSYPFTYTSDYSVMASRPSNFTYNNSMPNPVGQYRRTFTIPADWDGRDVFLRFNGAGHGYYVWVNGSFVGYAEDSYLPSEFNVTDKLHAGENNVSVQVYRFTSGSFLECQDYWRLTGITRDVYLYSTAKDRISDFFFRTTQLLEDNTAARASLRIDVEKQAATSGLTAEIAITDGATVVTSATKAIASTAATFSIAASDIEPWSAENPKLYDLIIRLKRGDEVVDLRSCKVGFRTVSIRNDGALLVNGNPIIIHGVNRHSFSATGGRTVSREEVEWDMRAMKQLNVNAVRTSHYPNNPYFYELCDLYGLYVLAEADVECHGNTGLSSVAAFRAPMVERSERQVLSLRNHACIFGWSAGNESGGGNNFEAVMARIKQLDTSRITHYEGNSQWSDVSSTMYGSYSNMKSIGEDRLRGFESGQSQRPHIQCENTHSMGNSQGNQKDYYNDIYERYPAMAGEFVWDWRDQGLRKEVPNKPGQYFDAYGGDFGDYPNDGNFCCNGAIMADGTFTAKTYNMKAVYQPLDVELTDSINRVFTLKSKLAHVQLDYIDCAYELLEDGIAIQTGTIDVNLAPGETAEWTLPETANLRNDAEYYVRFFSTLKTATMWAEAGHEVARSGCRIREALSREAYQPQQAPALAVETRTNRVDITGDNFTASFGQGILGRYTYNGKSIISSGLKLNVFRAPTDNDKGIESTWNSLGLRSLTSTYTDWTVTEADDKTYVDVENVVTYKTTSTLAFEVTQKFRVFADGAIAMSTYTKPNLTGQVLPKLGFRMEMPKEFEQMSWLGRGPMDSYRDRRDAALNGVYHSTATDQWTPHVRPQETGNKEEVAWLRLANDEGDGLLVVAPEKMATTVGHWRAEELYTAPGNRKMHPYEVSFTNNTIVSLDAYNRALGNNSCGPDVLSKYERYSDGTPLDLVLLPITGNLSDEEVTAKSRISCPIRVERPEDTEFQADKSLWSLYGVSSEQGGSERATNAFDGDEETIWHTQWSPQEPACPHEIVVDMGRTYRVSSFTYKGRNDGSNGRIREYEIYFSNNPLVWGEPAAAGTWNDNSARQQVGIPGDVEARYFKLVARSSMNDKPWASAAELYVGVQEIVETRDEALLPINPEHVYRIKDVQSGLYIHYLPDTTTKYEGDYQLGRPSEGDNSYDFTFERAPGYTTFYKVRSANRYMAKNEGDSWRIVGATTSTSPNAYMQVEQLANGQVHLRCGWQKKLEVNFDSHNVGSFIYSDKSTGAPFILEDLTLAAAIPSLPSNSAGKAVSLYDLQGRRLNKAPRKGTYIKNGKKRVAK